MEQKDWFHGNGNGEIIYIMYIWCLKKLYVQVIW